MSSDESDPHDSASSSSDEIQDLSEFSFAEIKKIRKLDTTKTKKDGPRMTKEQVEELRSIGKKRKDKDAPIEKSSKIPVGREKFRVDGPAREKTRDPRFTGPQLSLGQRARFRDKYSFLQERQTEELAEIKEALKKTQDEGERDRLVRARKILEGGLKREKDLAFEYQVNKEHIAEQAQRVEEGKEFYQLTARQVKERVQKKRFEELEASGQLSRHLAKKRQRIAAKDMKRIPSKRPKLQETHDD